MLSLRLCMCAWWCFGSCFFLPFSDSVANADLVAVGCSSVDVPVASLWTCVSGESNFMC